MQRRLKTVRERSLGRFLGSDRDDAYRGRGLQAASTCAVDHNYFLELLGTNRMSSACTGMSRALA